VELRNDFSKSLDTPLFKVVSEEASSLGIKAYVIGGFVRDHLLNRGNKKDIDIVAIGSGIRLAKSVQKKIKRIQTCKSF
jgi:tRNA nucleotidyltransferase (CCA-adding enzyme)